MKIALISVTPTKIAQQWPSKPPAEFADVQFLFGHAEGADHVAIMNGVPEDTLVHCAPDRIWCFVQEPPVRQFAHYYKGQQAFSRMYVPMHMPWRPRRVSYWGALNWHVGKSYDDLVSQPPPAKQVDLCWVTSNYRFLRGQRHRLDFLEALRRADIEVDLWGRGFRYIETKWDVMSRARYCLAIENFAGEEYWTEKLADCFLAYSTPIYYGSPYIERYFPRNSYIAIDPNDPRSVEEVRDVVNSRFHEQNFEALLEARELCLHRYNTLFFIAREAKAHRGKPDIPRWVDIKKAVPGERTLSHRIEMRLHRLCRRIAPTNLRNKYRQLRAL